jgi:hypothetical protein
MTIVQQLIDTTQTAEQPSLASWYTQGDSDALGDRLLMFDNTRAPAWELLRFRSELVLTDGFVASLRERVERLGRFQHPAFPTVRAVDDLGDGKGPALVSTYIPGKRLSAALQRPRSAAFVMRVIRELTPALAALQKNGEGIAHGMLTADRVVVTTDGHIVIREHVLASAVERIGLPASRLCADLGVVIPVTPGVPPRLDARTDVIQIGIIALSLMVGRQIGPADYPGGIEELLAFVEATDRLSWSPLRQWLGRALQLEDQAFESARDAHEALRELPDEAPRVEPSHPLRTFDHTRLSLPDVQSDVPGSKDDHRDGDAQAGGLPSGGGGDQAPGHIASEADPQPVADAADPLYIFRQETERRPVARVQPPKSTGPALRIQSVPSSGFAQPTYIRPTEPPVAPAVRPGSGSVREGRPSVIYSGPQSLTEGRPVVPWHVEHPSVAPVARAIERSRPLRWIAASVALLALGEAALIAHLLYTRPSAAPVEPVIVVDSLQADAEVLVDGRSAGVTPLELKVGSGTRSISVINRKAAPRKKPNDRGEPPSAGEWPNPVDPPGPVEPQPQRAVGSRTIDSVSTSTNNAASGGVKISSPIDVTVFEGEQQLGSSEGEPIVVPPGRHEFDFVNEALGYRAHRVVEITAGDIRPLLLSPAKGSINITASPWAEVWIDGHSVGGTPLEHLSVPIGEHEIMFRHPRFGEWRTRAIVRADTPAQVSANLRR